MNRQKIIHQLVQEVYKEFSIVRVVPTQVGSTKSVLVHVERPETLTNGMTVLRFVTIRIEEKEIEERLNPPSTKTETKHGENSLEIKPSQEPEGTNV